uniref:Fas apoptotic inhibitory molecule 1 n=1 Tax=Clastoptera arizonana TaxID=38151 RepID=A0A1B6D3V5_9HEMI
MADQTESLAALWKVPLNDRNYLIEFFHNTTTGKRVIIVDGKKIVSTDWMFKLVGSEEFLLGIDESRCVINIEPNGPFSYEYTLCVDGMDIQKFVEVKSRTCCTWNVQVSGKDYRVVLGRIY